MFTIAVTITNSFEVYFITFIEIYYDRKRQITHIVLDLSLLWNSLLFFRSPIIAQKILCMLLMFLVSPALVNILKYIKSQQCICCRKDINNFCSCCSLNKSNGSLKPLINESTRNVKKRGNIKMLQNNVKNVIASYISYSK